MNTRMLAAAIAALAVSVAMIQVAAAQEPTGRADGVKVHGHWTLVARNADGTEAARQEFDNALITTIVAGAERSGSELLAAILGGGLVPGPWVVQLDCAAGASCVQAIENSPDAPLTKDNPSSSTLRLSGTYTVPTNASATVTGVRTLLFYCQNTSTAAQCTARTVSLGHGATVGAFSGTTVPSPMQIAPGQVVQFSVTFSFS